MQKSETNPLRVLIIGAHPDDAEYKVGGTAALWRAAGHAVTFVSVADGAAGHQLHPGPRLVARRAAESAAAAAVIGAEVCNLGFPDGGVLPTLEARHVIIRLIRQQRPDLVITHRLNDYHPDHRYTAQLVQDAAYLVTVPAICPEVPHLPVDPVYAYMSDHFTVPTPFRPTVAVDIGPVFDKVIAMLDAHASQFYEWLPYNHGLAEQVPPAEQPTTRRAWLADLIRTRIAPLAIQWRSVLALGYGAERAATVVLAEGFEGSEYGQPLNSSAVARLFPFVRP